MNGDHQVYVERDDPVGVRSVAALDALLDRVAAAPRYQEFPVVVDIVAPDDRHILQIMLGRPDISLLVWHVEGETIEASVGTVTHPQPLAFNYGGARTDAYDDTVIPLDIAREAARQFVVEGSRPTVVAWKTPRYS
jgi:hypothetical protein